jgi:tRNA (cytidine/uridine-2'-O-)-methyltransferase
MNIMRLALFEPDIPQNCGTILRMAACFGVPVDIIEPCGFIFGGRQMRRAGMDYLDQVEVSQHASWAKFAESRAESQVNSRANLVGRLVLLTTRAEQTHTDFQFKSNDCLILGRESAGVPDLIHDNVDARLRIPMESGLRSLNVAISAAVVLGEALRQTSGFPK